MDPLTNSELLELIVLQRQNVDSQFEFWLTITFAFVVAIFAAKDRLSVQLKLFASALYLLATASFVGRGLLEGVELVVHISEAVERELIPDPFAWPLILRGIVMFLGTFGSLYFLYRADEIDK